MIPLIMQTIPSVMSPVSFHNANPVASGGTIKKTSSADEITIMTKPLGFQWMLVLCRMLYNQSKYI